MQIKHYSFGNITIDGEKYLSDLIIYKHNVDSWWRKEGHLLRQPDLKKIWKNSPEKLIVGTGAYGGMKVDSGVYSKCKERGIELIVQKTARAVEIFNSRFSAGRDGAAFHLTC